LEESAFDAPVLQDALQKNLMLILSAGGSASGLADIGEIAKEENQTYLYQEVKANLKI
jgi:hypothetical protein